MESKQARRETYAILYRGLLKQTDSEAWSDLRRCTCSAPAADCHPDI
jgi:hypothetical protein